MGVLYGLFTASKCLISWLALGARFRVFNRFMEEKEALIALNMIEHVGPVRVRHLLAHFGTAPAILGATREQLGRVHGIGDETAAAIARWESDVDLSAELGRIREFGCHVLTQEDDAYPRPLREIYDPPIVLYVRGEIRGVDHRGVAIVGSRLTTPYGMDCGRKFAMQLAVAGVTVVSGGARGIDTAAHQGALKSGGRTIAVLGTGINVVFPHENAALFEQIANHGAVVTQFPFNRPADKQSFPIRNRIVAGMTLGTLVVEANLTSGALITANMAVDCGRQVFAVPGRVDSPRSKGCHELIKKGAKLCESVEDLLSEFEYLFPPRNARQIPSEADFLTPLLNEVEQTVFDELGREEMGMEEIILKSGFAAGAVASTLLNLEIKRLIRQVPGKRFIRLR